MSNEIIIVGAGACGLMAARILSAAGKNVRIIEAQSRAGGRIYTIPPNEFSIHAEAGAEFVHGNLPITIGLLNEAGLSYHKIEGELWNAREGRPYKQDDFIEHQNSLIRKLKELKLDMSVREFLDINFSDEKFADLRTSIVGYVQGYELADLDKASTLSLREEWLNNEHEDQYRIDKGYGALIRYLQEECEHNGCVFDFNTTIKRIEWKKGEAKLSAEDGRVFDAVKVIITVPLGVLQSESSCKAFIQFIPAIQSKLEAVNAMGFGRVIKFLLEFNEAFWENKNVVGDKRMKNAGFIFADTVIPTWWTQAPAQNPILTGWLGGPGANKWKELNDEGLLQLAINSLSDIFHIDHAVLVEKIVAWRVFNWAKDNYSLGGYAYESLHRKTFLSVLATPEDDTLFFSGEALEKESTTLGTVEAALACGLQTAEGMLQS